MPRTVSDSKLRAVLKAYKRCESNLSEAAKLLNIPRSTAEGRLRLAKSKFPTEFSDQGPVANDCNGPSKKWEVDNRDNQKAIWSIDDRIKTVEDAVTKANVDLEIWEVERSVINSWEVGVKGGLIDNEPIIKVQTLWQVKVWLRRKVQKVYEDAVNGLIERMAKHAPTYKSVKKSNGDHLLEVSIFDLHFGKLAWERETGSNYDLKIAERVFANAVTDLLSKSRGFSVDRVLFPIGQDFFHIDNPTKTTVNNTPQDVDARYSKLFEAGTMACVHAIDMLRESAPVKVLYVPGNHDRTSAWHLAAFLSAWYRNDDEVEIDMAPTTRKYEHYGCNLLGFTHGDEENHRDLPTIMASEVPNAWAESTCREWHLGHFHKKKETRHVTGDSYGPVHVRVLPSMSGTDAWHYRKGYVQGRRAAEAYVWNKLDGYVGHFSVNSRQ